MATNPNDTRARKAVGKFARALLATTCLTVATGVAVAGTVTYTEGTAPAPNDFSSTFSGAGASALAAAAISGTTIVNGSTNGGGRFDYIELTGLGRGTRAEAINRIVAETTPTALPPGSVVSSFVILAGVESGDLEFEAAVTYMPDLPAVDFSAVTIERLAVDEALSRCHLKLQVLDRLDEACTTPLLPFLIEREFATIWNAAKTQGQPPQDAAEFRAIAERRLRLGLMVGEIARRHGITARTTAELEDRVIDLLLSQSRISERQATPEELADLTDEQ